MHRFDFPWNLFTKCVPNTNSKQHALLIDWDNSIVSTCDIKKNKYISFIGERQSKVTSIVNFILSKFWILPQGVSKVIFHTARKFVEQGRFLAMLWEYTFP